MLVVKLDHIGDFALALPGLWGLKQALPEAEIDVVVGPVNLGWKEVVPWIGRFRAIQFPAYQTGREQKDSKLRLARNMARLAASLCVDRYDIAVDLRTEPHDWRGKFVVWLSRASRRIGGSGTGRIFLSEVCDRQNRREHVADQIACRLRQIAPDLSPTLKGSVAVHRTAAKSDLRQILLHPGAGSVAKRWPIEYWGQLAGMLARERAVSARFLGGPGDKALIAEICARGGFDSGEQIVSRSLRETLQHLADSDLLVGLDSAGPHMAALVGTPAITIFSGTVPLEEWRALGENTVLSHKVECSPCFSATCLWPEHRCMEAITPDAVLRVIRKKLRLD